jgi:peptidoglycan/xylan/chitin deacetylase (PgdA/CDA1 family)
MESIVLKVDVDTFMGTRDGVPALLDLFNRHGVNATFLFSLGPDHTGRAIRRIFRPGFLKKVSRTSVVSNYGIRTLLYGVVLPGPHIGRKLSSVMRRAREEGHEVGIHCYDHVLWQDFVADKGYEWTRRQMQLAHDAFVDATGIKPSTLGAAGWQINAHAIAIEQEMGFEFASDVRGRAPFFPVLNGTESTCMQIPTTLPTLDELIGTGGITGANVHEEVIRQSRLPLPHGHVFTLHAELEGLKLLHVMDSLLARWIDDGRSLITLRQLYDTLDPAMVPRRQIVPGRVPGRSGDLAVEGSKEIRQK